MNNNLLSLSPVSLIYVCSYFPENLNASSVCKLCICFSISIFKFPEFTTIYSSLLLAANLRAPLTSVGVLAGRNQTID